MKYTLLARAAAVTLAAAAFVACSDGPNAPTSVAPDAALAASFDAIAAEGGPATEAIGSEAFTWVSQALRNGAVPSEIYAMTNGHKEWYLAFVRELPPEDGQLNGRRTLFAWQKPEGGGLHFIAVETHPDFGNIVPMPTPINAPVDYAHATYIKFSPFGGVFTGMSGVARLANRFVGDRVGVNQYTPWWFERYDVFKATYGIMFESHFALRDAENDRDIVVIAPTQAVRGFKLMYPVVEN